MLKDHFQYCVSQIVGVILGVKPGLEKLTDRHKQEITGFVMRQHSRMPVLLGWPIIGLTLFFNFSSMLVYLKSFNRLSAARQADYFLQWKHSRIGLMNDFTRFYESLVVLKIYEYQL